MFYLRQVNLGSKESIYLTRAYFISQIISSMSLCICLILLLGAVILSTSPTNPDDERAQFAEMQKEQTKKMLSK